MTSVSAPSFEQINSLVMGYGGEEHSIRTPIDAHNILGMFFEDNNTR